MQMQIKLNFLAAYWAFFSLTSRQKIALHNISGSWSGRVQVHIRSSKFCCLVTFLPISSLLIGLDRPNCHQTCFCCVQEKFFFETGLTAFGKCSGFSSAIFFHRSRNFPFYRRKYEVYSLGTRRQGARVCSHRRQTRTRSS